MTLFNEILNGKDSTNVSASNNNQSNVLSSAAKAEAIQGWLIDKLAEVLEIEPNQIDVGQDFEEYGLESAEAINLSGDLEDYLSCRLPPTLLWDYQNIETLAQHLAKVNLSANQPDSSELKALPSFESDSRSNIPLENYQFNEFPEYKKLLAQREQLRQW
jgi:8-amino-7-oxononanoate synthase